MGGKNQQTRPSKREQEDPEMDPETEEDQTEGEAEPTDLQRKHYEAASSTYSNALG